MNMKRTTTGGRAVMEARRTHLREWLGEWALDRALRETPPLSPAPRNGAETARGAAMRVRDIVLLHPADTPSAERPVYVALLAGPDAGEWFVAPFGPFAAPAGDGEWLTGRTVAPLRVLCLWNARRMPAPVVVRGWRAGRLTPREHATALRVWRAWREGSDLDARTRARTGAPIVHPRDPRREYEAEEAQWMDEAAADPEGRCGPAPGYAVPDSDWALAAEPPRDAPRGRRARRDPT